jgi:hypothetical protein
MANGTIAFDTLSSSGQITGTAKSVDTDYVVNGSAKAWVNFNGTGTIATRDSFNTASLTDGGTGDYVLNFSNVMSDANYSVTGSSSVLIGSFETMFVPNFKPPGTETASTTSAFQFAVLRPSTTQPYDVPYVYVQVHGDLA